MNIRVKIVIAMLVSLGAVTGCATNISKEKLGLSREQANQVVTDLASAIARQYRVANTTVVVSVGANLGFGRELVESLKQRGVKTVAVPSWQKSDTGEFSGKRIIGVKYETQLFDGYALVVVRGTDGYSISRTYRMTGSSIHAHSPISVVTPG